MRVLRVLEADFVTASSILLYTRSTFIALLKMLFNRTYSRTRLALFHVFMFILKSLERPTLTEYWCLSQYSATSDHTFVWGT